MDGIISLLRNIIHVATMMRDVYAKYIAPFDPEGLLKSTVINVNDAYRAIVWPFLSWLSPTDRDVAVILALVYLPQYVTIALATAGRAYPSVRQPEGWRFWTSWRALFTIALLSQVLGIELLYRFDELLSPLQIILWMIPLYWWQLIAYFRSDVASLRMEALIVLGWSVAFYFAWLALMQLTYRQLSYATFQAGAVSQMFAMIMAFIKLANFEGREKGEG